MSKDWTGNAVSMFKTLGASNHADHERQAEDYYATEPKATEWMCKLEHFAAPILEPSCGEGHLAKVLMAHGYEVECRDLVNRGFGTSGKDFLAIDNTTWHGYIITNSPYKFALEFERKALSIIPNGHKVAMFLKIQFLEGKARRQLFDSNPPKTVWVSSSRLKCAMNGEFDAVGSSASCYAWFVWEKGYQGDTVVRWFN